MENPPKTWGEITARPIFQDRRGAEFLGEPVSLDFLEVEKASEGFDLWGMRLIGLVFA